LRIVPVSSGLLHLLQFPNRSIHAGCLDFDESPALFIPSTLFLPLDSRHYHYRDPKNYKIILRRKRKINETKLKYQKTSAVLCYESNFSTYFIHSLQKYNRIHFSERSLKIRSSFAQQL
jgi:hypothetical protein